MSIILLIFGFLRKRALFLFFAIRHPETPTYARAMMLTALAYFISPIDVVPDAIPFAGLLDDAAAIPIAAALKNFLPDSVCEECERKATQARLLINFIKIAILGLILYTVASIFSMI